MSDGSALARQMWQVLEPVHATLYYAPQAFERAAALGYETQTRGPSYFAWRLAPMGPVGSHLASAVCYSFSPRMVAEYVPATWAVADPVQVLEARSHAVDRTLRALLGDLVDSDDVAEAAALARRAAGAADTAGRALAAANADLPWPEQPHLQLWQAALVLREHRGDGHVAALIAAGLDPCEALVSFAAVGAAPVEVFASRGWSGQEWAAAADRLRERGWIDASGTATTAGTRVRDEVEQRTDELAMTPWRALGEQQAGRLARLTAPLAKTIAASGILPRHSTLGMGATR